MAVDTNIFMTAHVKTFALGGIAFGGRRSHFPDLGTDFTLRFTGGIQTHQEHGRELGLAERCEKVD